MHQRFAGALGAAERREQRGHLADHLADGFAHAAHFGLALFVAGRIDAVFVAQALEADQQLAVFEGHVHRYRAVVATHCNVGCER